MKLDGREFEGLSQALTARQNDYITVHLRLSGASEIFQTFSDQDDKDQRLAKAQDVMNRILESGRKYQILAGILTEKGHRWTRAEAEANAEKFSDITELEEQRLMNDEVLNLVIGFFKFAEVSSATSRISSSPKPEGLDTSNEAQEITANSAS